MESKIEALESLKEKIVSDTKLPLYGKANLVFGEGDVNSKVMFIGEAPGFYEDRDMRPFVGRAGQLLNTLLSGLTWPRERVYITNIVKRRPPENRDPEPAEIVAYKPYLKKQIEIINPTVIATLGRFSMNYFLPLAKISQDHGKAMKIGSRVIFILYHPAAALRSTSVLEALEKDFKRLPALLKTIENGTVK